MERRGQVAVLGPLSVVGVDGQIPLGAGRARWVLAALALARGAVVSVAELIDVLWPEKPPKGSRNTLQTHVAELRRRLRAAGLDIVASEGAGYRLDCDEVVLDLDQFHEDRHAAASTAGLQRLAALRSARGRWRGEPLSDLVDEGFPAARVVPLARARAAVLAEWAQHELELGDSSLVREQLEPAAVTDPTDERIWVLLARARAAGGDQLGALSAIREIRAALAEHGLVPTSTVEEAEGQVLRHEITVANPAVPIPRPLPRTRTSLIGRDEELALVERLLGEHRLVTLTGSGGVGKTRVALAVAERLAASGQRVAAAELAPVDDADGVVAQLAAAVGIAAPLADEPLLDQVTSVLANARAVVIMDNAEHVLAVTASVVDQLLDACPHLKVLVTSRRPLGIGGEQRAPLDPLDVATGVALLESRARMRNPRFVLGVDTRASAESIVARVDGLPLGVELAAARLDRCTTTELLAELDGEGAAGLRGGTRDRHGSLDAVLRWSFELLDDVERRALAWLAVVRGSLSVADCSTICSAAVGPAAEAAIASLAGQSLVTIDTSGSESRLRLLDTVRRFASARLAEQGDADAASSQHLAVLARRSKDFEACRSDASRVVEFVHLEPDVRAAFSYAVGAGDGRRALRIALNLFFYLRHRGRLAEARTLLDEALQCGGDPAPGDRAMTLLMTAAAISDTGDFAASVPLEREAVELAVAANLAPLEGYARLALGRALYVVDGAAAGERELTRSLTCFDVEDDHAGRGFALLNLAWERLATGNHAGAVDAANTIISQPDLPDEAHGVALVVLGARSILDGDLDAGRAQCAAGEALVQHSGPELTWLQVMWAGAELGAGSESAAAEKALSALRRARQAGQREVLPWLLQISGALAHRRGRAPDGASLLATAASRKLAWGWRMRFEPVDAATDGLAAGGPSEDLAAAVVRASEVLDSIAD